MEYKTYSVKYVKALERATGLFILLTGMIVPVLSYQLMGKPVGAPAGIEEPAIAAGAADPLAERAKIEARIEALLQAKMGSEARAFVKKVNPSLSWTTVEKIVRKGEVASKEHNVPFSIGLAVAWQESHFNPNAVSPTGPRGIYQVAYTYWKDACSLSSREQLMRLDKNIDCGYRALAQYKKRYGTWELALYHYHGHPTDLALNRKYSLTVMARARKIHTLIMT